MTICSIFVYLSYRENNGPTPLQCASIEGHHNVVKLLVEHGAKVEPLDLQRAIEEGKE